MKIRVSQDKCVGAGNCVQVAPKYFDQNVNTGIVEVLRDYVDSGDGADVEEAVALCPVAAIQTQRQP